MIQVNIDMYVERKFHLILDPPLSLSPLPLPLLSSLSFTPFSSLVTTLVEPPGQLLI